MAKPFKGTINIDIRDSVPDWEPYTQPMAPEGAPNVLYIVLDDVGFSAMEPFGGLIETPNINRIAERRPHVHELPHDGALLADARLPADRPQPHDERDGVHHRGDDRVPERRTATSRSSARTLAEVLGERGWNTYAVGKWHLTAEDEMNLASRKSQWPLGRGFERFYGFLGGETNQWYPDLVYDNHPVEQPSLAGGRATTSAIDITDKALAFIRDAKAIAPDKPFFLYFCPGACHAPHHVPDGVGGQVQGPLRHGLRGVPRERVRAPEAARRSCRTSAELSPINPYIDETSDDGEDWPRGSTRSAPGSRCPTTRSVSSAAWPRSTPASSATPTTRSGGCSTTSRRPASSTTR